MVRGAELVLLRAVCSAALVLRGATGCSAARLLAVQGAPVARQIVVLVIVRLVALVLERAMGSAGLWLVMRGGAAVRLVVVVLMAGVLWAGVVLLAGLVLWSPAVRAYLGLTGLLCCLCRAVGRCGCAPPRAEAAAVGGALILGLVEGAQGCILCVAWVSSRMGRNRGGEVSRCACVAQLFRLRGASGFGQCLELVPC